MEGGSVIMDRMLIVIALILGLSALVGLLLWMLMGSPGDINQVESTIDQTQGE